MKKAIVFFETRGAARAYVTLLRSVSDAGFVPILKEADALRERPTLHAAHAAGVPCVDWRVFTSPAHRRLAADTAKAKVNALEGMEHVRRLGGSPFLRALQRKVEAQILAVMAARVIKEKYDVRLFVVGSDHSEAARAVMRWAQAHAIPGLSLGDGWYGAGREADPGATMYGDYAAVGSEPDRQRLLAAGVPPSRVFVTGWPGTAERGRPIDQERAIMRDARLALGMPPDRPAVLLRIPSFQGDRGDFVRRFRFGIALHRAVLDATRSVQGGFQLIIEPANEEQAAMQDAGIDPAGQVRSYEAWLDTRGYRDVYVVRDTAGAALRAADLVVCPERSPAVVEGMLHRRPVVAVAMGPDEPLAHEGLVGPVILRRLDRLVETISGLLMDPGRVRAVVQRQNQHLAEVNHSADGLAAERLARLVLALGKEGRVDAGTWDEPTPDIITARVAMRVADTDRLLEGISNARRLRDQQPDQAERAIRDIARAFPRHAQPIWELYDQLRKAGRVEEAEHALEVFATSFDDIHPPITVLVRIGLARLRHGQRDAALEAFELARLQAPYEPAVLTSLGKLYLDSGRHAEALDLFSDASQHLPDDAEIWLGLAHAARQVDDRETFRAATEQYHTLANRIDPTGS